MQSDLFITFEKQVLLLEEMISIFLLWSVVGLIIMIIIDNIQFSCNHNHYCYHHYYYLSSCCHHCYNDCGITLFIIIMDAKQSLRYYYYYYDCYYYYFLLHHHYYFHHRHRHSAVSDTSIAPDETSAYSSSTVPVAHCSSPLRARAPSGGEPSLVPAPLEQQLPLYRRREQQKLPPNVYLINSHGFQKRF